MGWKDKNLTWGWGKLLIAHSVHGVLISPQSIIPVWIPQYITLVYTLLGVLHRCCHFYSSWHAQNGGVSHYCHARKATYGTQLVTLGLCASWDVPNMQADLWMAKVWSLLAPDWFGTANEQRGPGIYTCQVYRGLISEASFYPVLERT